MTDQTTMTPTEAYGMLAAQAVAALTALVVAVDELAHIDDLDLDIAIALAFIAQEGRDVGLQLAEAGSSIAAQIMVLRAKATMEQPAPDEAAE